MATPNKLLARPWLALCRSRPKLPQLTAVRWKVFPVRLPQLKQVLLAALITGPVRRKPLLALWEPRPPERGSRHLADRKRLVRQEAVSRVFSKALKPVWALPLRLPSLQHNVRVKQALSIRSVRN